MKQLIKAINNLIMDIQDLFPSKELYKKRVFTSDLDAIKFFNKKCKNHCAYLNWYNPFNGTPYSVEWCKYSQLCK